jgi:hypothetical protein
MIFQPYNEKFYKLLDDTYIYMYCGCLATIALIIHIYINSLDAILHEGQSLRA